jgi:hypothetical protein
MRNLNNDRHAVELGITRKNGTGLWNRSSLGKSMSSFASTIESNSIFAIHSNCPI